MTDYMNYVSVMGTIVYGLFFLLFVVTLFVKHGDAIFLEFPPAVLLIFIIGPLSIVFWYIALPIELVIILGIIFAKWVK